MTVPGDPKYGELSLDEVVALLNLLGDSLKLRILRVLAAAPNKTLEFNALVTELRRIDEASSSRMPLIDGLTVERHLATLRRYGLVDDFTLTTGPLTRLIKALIAFHKAMLAESPPPDATE